MVDDAFLNPKAAPDGKAKTGGLSGAGTKAVMRTIGTRRVVKRKRGGTNGQ